MTRSVLLLAVVLLSLPSGSRAQVADDEAPRTRLEWRHGPGADRCIGRTELIASVEERLGRAAFRDDAELVIDGRVEVNPTGGFRVVLLLQHAGEAVGERVLSSEVRNCRLLDPSIAVVLALLVDVGRSSVELQLPPETPPRPADEPAHDAPPMPSGGRAGWGAILDAGGELSRGLVPGWTGGLAAGLELLTPTMLSVRADLLVGPEGGASFGGGRGARFGATLFGLWLCGDVHLHRRVSVGGCAGGRAGEIRGTGFGFDEASSGAVTWVSLDARLRARIGIIMDEEGGMLFLGLSGGMGIELSSRVFRVQPGGTEQVAHNPATVVPQIRIVLGARLR